VPARRDAQLDTVADLLIAHLDVDAVCELLETGPPPRPTLVTNLHQ
jgi:adenosylcobyric acid synthase